MTTKTTRPPTERTQADEEDLSYMLSFREPEIPPHVPVTVMRAALRWLREVGGEADIHIATFVQPTGQSARLSAWQGQRLCTVCMTWDPGPLRGVLAASSAHDLYRRTSREVGQGIVVNNGDRPALTLDQWSWPLRSGRVRHPRLPDDAAPSCSVSAKPVYGWLREKSGPDVRILDWDPDQANLRLVGFRGARVAPSISDQQFVSAFLGWPDEPMALQFATADLIFLLAPAKADESAHIRLAPTSDGGGWLWSFAIATVRVRRSSHSYPATLAVHRAIHGARCVPLAAHVQARASSE